MRALLEVVCLSFYTPCFKSHNEQYQHVNVFHVPVAICGGVSFTMPPHSDLYGDDSVEDDARVWERPILLFVVHWSPT